MGEIIFWLCWPVHLPYSGIESHIFIYFQTVKAQGSLQIPFAKWDLAHFQMGFTPFCQMILAENLQEKHSFQKIFCPNVSYSNSKRQRDAGLPLEPTLSPNGSHHPLIMATAANDLGSFIILLELHANFVLNIGTYLRINVSIEDSHMKQFCG